MAPECSPQLPSDRLVQAALPHTRGVLRLWAYGLGMLAPAAYFAWRYPLPGNDKLTDLGNMAHYRVHEFVAFVGGMALLFVLYLLALRESGRLPAGRALPAVFVCGAALAGTMAWMYPVNAIDIFIYAVRSRLFTEYGVNPIVGYPKDYPADPLMGFASEEWADDVSPYGPLWNLIAAPITFLAGDQLSIALVGFKVLATASLLAGGWVIARVLTATRPADAARGALYYLWNPLVLWEGAGNGHNDVVMCLPLLLAFLAWVRRWDRAVLPLLVVAALIKYVTVLLIPIAAVALWRRAEGWPRRWQLAGWSAALSAITTAAAFFPFYDLDAVRHSVDQQSGILLTSPAAVAAHFLEERFPDTDVERPVRLAGGAILLAVMGWHAASVWARPSRLPRAAFEVLYIFLMAASGSFRSWYLIWPVGLAALLGSGWPAWRMIAWTTGAMSAYGFFIWVWAWWGADFYTAQNVAVALIFGATILLTVAERVCCRAPRLWTNIGADEEERAGRSRFHPPY